MRSNLKEVSLVTKEDHMPTNFPHMYLQSRKGEVYGIRVKLQLIDDVPINVVTLMTDKDQ